MSRTLHRARRARPLTHKKSGDESRSAPKKILPAVQALSKQIRDGVLPWQRTSQTTALTASDHAWRIISWSTFLPATTVHQAPIDGCPANQDVGLTNRCPQRFRRMDCHSESRFRICCPTLWMPTLWQIRRKTSPPRASRIGNSPARRSRAFFLRSPWSWPTRVACCCLAVDRPAMAPTSGSVTCWMPWDSASISSCHCSPSWDFWYGSISRTTAGG